MNYTTSKQRIGAALLAGMAATALSFGQNGSSDESADDDVFVLTPFEVSEPSDDSYYGSDSISGTRTRTDLKNLAMSMQVFTENLMRDVAGDDLIDVVTFASGVSQGAGQGTKDDDDDTNFTIRGVQTYLPMRNGFRRLRLASGANIQQVEVLKGPASLLYGQLAPGGTVNYITKRATPTKNFGSVSAGFGSYNLMKGSLDTNIVLMQDKLAFRLVGSILDTDAIEDRYHRTVTLLNPTLTWLPTDKTKVTLDYEVNARDSDAPVGNIPWNNTIYLLDDPGEVDRSFNTRASGDYTNTEMTTTAIEVVHEFNRNWTARANVTESVWRMDKRLNSTSSSLNTTSYNIGNRSLQLREWGSWDDFHLVELVNNFETENIKVQNIFGYQASNLEFRNIHTGSLASGVSNPSIRWNLYDKSTWEITELTAADTQTNVNATGNRSTNDNESFYFTNQLTMLDGKLHTLAGIRVEKLDTIFYRNITGETTVTEADDAKVPQLGALYKPTENISVYASYSESFNPAFSTLRNEQGEYYTPVPETGEGYDLGIKMEIPEANISLSAAIFTIDRTNIIRTLAPVVDPDDPTTTFNPSRQSGVETSEGFELDLRWKPSEKSQLIFSYGFTDAFISSDEQSAEAREGHDLINAPQHTLAFLYRQNMAGFGPFEKTFFTVSGRAITSRAQRDTRNFIDEVYVDAPRLPGYELFNFGVGGTIVSGEREIDLRLNIKNAFDEVYLAHRFAFGNPRTAEFSIRTKF
ncbi:TonB-dependent receptor [Puniceicoccaceae bacterium K14]|nr:TonB-dependent receptor [Puniceicoccaceae bacterium K14]